MMAAGLKSSTSRQSRKSKGSQVGTPGSTSSASTMHGQSPYQTPTQASAPYGGYMYDASQQHNGASYPYAPGVSSMTAQTQSAQSSRVPSPVNGHSTASSMHSAQQQHQQQFYPQQQPFYTAYPGSTYGQPYRYSPGGAPIPSAYGPPSHHHLYSPGVAPEHGGQQHMYSPIQSFTPNSRDQYNVLAQGYPQAQMGNGYPPRTQSSTPLSATHDELDPRYRTAQRTPSSPRRRLTPPQAEMLSTGVVDPSSMSTNASGHSAAPRASLGAVSASPYSYASNGYASYGAHGMAPNGRDGAPVTLARANVEDSDTKGEHH
jgi:hypothetical protein